MTRPDKTKPLPAPEGMKWVVSKTLLGYEGDPREYYSLGLFPEGVEVDEWGSYRRRFGRSRNFPNGGWVPGYAITSAIFCEERQILRTSRRVLADYHRKHSDESLFTRLRKAFS